MRPGPILTRVLAVTAVAAVAACTGTRDDSSFAERQELANIRTKHVVPLSSGAVLMNTFRSTCLEGGTSVADRTARLRAAGFVPVGGWRDGMRSFVTDDARPMVRLSDDGKLCGVTARARTGQDAAIRQRIAAWFRAARPITASGGMEEMWSTGRAPGEAIGVLHSARGPSQNEISVALLRL